MYDPNKLFMEQEEANKEFNLQLENLKLKSQLSKLREVSEKMKDALEFFRNSTIMYLPSEDSWDESDDHLMPSHRKTNEALKSWQAFLESENT